MIDPKESTWNEIVRREGRGRSGNFVAPRCHPYFYWCNQRGSGPRRTQMCLFGRSKNRGIAARSSRQAKAEIADVAFLPSSFKQERLPGPSGYRKPARRVDVTADCCAAALSAGTAALFGSTRASASERFVCAVRWRCSEMLDLWLCSTRRRPPPAAWRAAWWER